MMGAPYARRVRHNMLCGWRMQAPHDHVRRAAEEAGVFGVPTYVLDGDIYWGREHLPSIRAWLEEAGLRRPGGDGLRLERRVGGRAVRLPDAAQHPFHRRALGVAHAGDLRLFAVPAGEAVGEIDAADDRQPRWRAQPPLRAVG